MYNMAGDEPTILISDAGSIRTITLNRPDVLNAFNTDMLKALSKTVREADKDKSVRCLVFAAAGRAFASGQDLAEVADRYKSDEPIELGQSKRKKSKK